MNKHKEEFKKKPRSKQVMSHLKTDIKEEKKEIKDDKKLMKSVKRG